MFYQGCERAHKHSHATKKACLNITKGRKPLALSACIYINKLIKKWLKGKTPHSGRKRHFIESANTGSVCLKSILSSIKHKEGTNIYALSKRISRDFSFNYQQISYAQRADNKGVSLPHCCGVAIRMESLGPLLLWERVCVCTCVSRWDVRFVQANPWPVELFYNWGPFALSTAFLRTISDTGLWIRLTVEMMSCRKGWSASWGRFKKSIQRYTDWTEHYIPALVLYHVLCISISRPESGSQNVTSL